MMNALRQAVKMVPALLTAFLMALAVWVLAVTSSDPAETRNFPRPIPLEIIGQDPGLVISGSLPKEVTVSMSAPRSVWNSLSTASNPVRAILDLTGLPAGEHSIEPRIQISVRPARVLSVSPAEINVNLEPLATRELPLVVVKRGEVEVGYEAGEPSLNPQTAAVSGPENLVNQVAELRVEVDLTGITEPMQKAYPIKALDSNGTVLEGLAVTPQEAQVKVDVVQRGGYRNVVVKVVLTGQVAGGHRLTNISVFPPAITVFSSNPELVNSLPGFVETTPLDLTGARDDLEVPLTLNLPSGITVVGPQTVRVQVGIATIEGSITLNAVPVSLAGLGAGLQAVSAPTAVDVILSGPLPVLEKTSRGEVKVVVNLSGLNPGTYKLTPSVELANPDLRLESIIPGTVEVTITRK